jgi:uncharacterized protein
METRKVYFTIIYFCVFVSLFTSCATYQTKTNDIQQSVFDSNFNVASDALDRNTFLLKDRNRLLYLLEKGKVEHLNGNYESSNNFLEQAYILVDDGIKTNIGQTLASNLTNPMAEPYKGEDFEKVLIHYYKALNYFQLGMREEAIVEAKRINIKLLKLNENYKENKNTYAKDAFSQIVLGVLFESTGQLNDAFIAYRNAEEIYASNKGSYFGVTMPEQLKVDLQRTSKMLGFTKEYNDYVKKYGKKTFSSKVIDEAIVFWENGIGPAKDQIKITASGAGGAFVGTYNDDMTDIIIPIPADVNLGINAIAIPKYVKRDSYYTSASLMINNKEQKFELCQDLYPIAKQCLKDRMLREVISIAIRFGTKKAASAGIGSAIDSFLPSWGKGIGGLAADGVNAATEKADTRNWQTLPASISYTRVPISNGENNFVFKKYSQAGVDIDTLNIAYKKGIQIISRTDFGSSKSNSTYSNPNLYVQKEAEDISSNQAMVGELVTDKAEPKLEKKKRVSENEGDARKSSIGIVAGLQYSNEVGDGLLETTPRSGYFAGLTFKANFSETLGLGIDLVYGTMGAEFKDAGLDDLQYIQMPITFNAKVFKVVSLQLGPQVGYLLSANFDGQDYIDVLNQFDYGVVGGLAFQFPKTNLGLMGRYYYGLANLNQSGLGMTNIKNTSYSLGAFYNF